MTELVFTSDKDDVRRVAAAAGVVESRAAKIIARASKRALDQTSTALRRETQKDFAVALRAWGRHAKKIRGRAGGEIRIDDKKLQATSFKFGPRTPERQAGKQISARRNGAWIEIRRGKRNVWARTFVMRGSGGKLVVMFHPRGDAKKLIPARGPSARSMVKISGAFDNVARETPARLARAIDGQIAAELAKKLKASK